MSKALKRLVALRGREKAAAAAVLQASCAERDREQGVLATQVGGPRGQAYAAGDLQLQQEQRQAAGLRLARLEGRIEAEQQALSAAKQALRQVELLLEAATRKQAAAVLRRETAEQEDWVRAKAHKEQGP